MFVIHYQTDPKDGKFASPWHELEPARSLREAASRVAKLRDPSSIILVTIGRVPGPIPRVQRRD